MKKLKTSLVLLVASPALCSAAGNITGAVEGIDKGNQGGLTIRGWACEGDSDRALDVRATFGKPAGQGVALLSGHANERSDGAPPAQCMKGGAGHAFRIAMSPRDAIRFAGRKVYVYGIASADDKSGNAELAGSGTFTVPDVAYTNVNCADWNGVVDRNIRLQPANCHIAKQVVFSAPNLSLDCNSATIDGKGVQTDPDGKGQGIGVASSQSVCRASERNGNQSRVSDADASGAVISNCKITNFKFGVFFERHLWTKPNPSASNCMAFGEFSAKSPQHLGPADVDQALGGRDKRYDFATSDVTLRNVEVSNIAADGIFVNEYARNWLIEDANVHDNGNGIYLERESRGTRVITSGVARNHNVGIAIDSSANNLLERNVVEGNGAIGIALYKNCGEGGGVTRYQHSDNNLIVNNTIRNQKGAGPKDMTLTQAELNTEAGNKGPNSLGVGVWIASRQGLSSSFMRQVYSKTPLACSDPGRDIQGQTYFPDFASGNQVTQNTITGNSLAQVIVEDDNNTVARNDMVGGDAPAAANIVVGSVFRKDDARGPVKNVQLQDNKLPDSGTRKSVVYLGGSAPANN